MGAGACYCVPCLRNSRTAGGSGLLHYTRAGQHKVLFQGMTWELFICTMQVCVPRELVAGGPERMEHVTCPASTRARG